MYNIDCSSDQQKSAGIRWLSGFYVELNMKDDSNIEYSSQT